MSEIDPKLSHAYREAAREEPPAALDAAILAAARERVARPQRRARASWIRWMAPASAVATLAIGVSIALLVEREQPATFDESSVRPAAPQPQGAPPAAEAAKAADSAVPAQTIKREAPAASVRAPASEPMRAAPAQPPAAAAPAPIAPAPAPAAVTPAPAPMRAEPVQPLNAPAAQAFPAESRERAAESKLSAPKAAAEANVARDAAAGAAGAPAATGRVAPLRKQAAQRSPQAWLEDIARLKREGRDNEATEQLAEFRKAYPAYPVPESLLVK